MQRIIDRCGTSVLASAKTLLVKVRRGTHYISSSSAAWYDRSRFYPLAATTTSQQTLRCVASGRLDQHVDVETSTASLCHQRVAAALHGDGDKSQCCIKSYSAFCSSSHWPALDEPWLSAPCQYEIADSRSLPAMQVRKQHCRFFFKNQNAMPVVCRHVAIHEQNCNCL